MKLHVAAIVVLATSAPKARAADMPVEKDGEMDRDLWYKGPTCLDWLPQIEAAKSRAECCPCCTYKICKEFFETDPNDYLLIDFWHKVIEYPKALSCNTEFALWNYPIKSPIYGGAGWFNNGHICAYNVPYGPYDGGDLIDNADPYFYYDYSYLGGTAVADLPGFEGMTAEIGDLDVEGTLSDIDTEDVNSAFYGCKGIIYSKKFLYPFCADTFEDCCYRKYDIGYPDGCGFERKLLAQEKKNIPHNRRTSEVDDGVAVHVESEHAERLEWLKSHVIEMKERMDKSDATREWDPLFQAYFDNVNDIDFSCENMGEQGMRCTSTSMTECGKDLIKAHMHYHEQIADSINRKGDHRVMMKHAVPDSCK